MDFSDIKYDPTGSNFTQSNLLTEEYWETRWKELLESQQAGTIDPQMVNPEGKIETEDQKFNQYIREREEQLQINTPDVVTSAQNQQPEKPFYDTYHKDGTSKRHKPIIQHPHYEQLKGDIPFDPKELSKEHPNYQAIYGETPTWSWGQAILGPLFTGQADTKMELYQNRKHMFTSGTGTADLATNIQETDNTIKGAAYQLVNGILQLPETGKSFFTGELFQKDFEMKWDPLASIGLEEPWTGTRFGDVGKVIGSMSAGGAGTAGLLSKLGKVQKLGRVSKYLAGMDNLNKVMLAEGLYMWASPYREDPGLANLLKESTFFGDVPVFKEALGLIAVGENDHPYVKMLKNTFESVGLVGIFGKIFGALAPPKAATKQLNLFKDNELFRIVDDLADQTGDAARVQIDAEAGAYRSADTPPTTRSRFGGYKNKGITGPGQAAPISRNTAGAIYKQLNWIDDMGGLGSTDSVMSVTEATNLASSASFTVDFLQGKAKELLSDPYMQGLLKDLKAEGLRFEDVFRPAFARFQEAMGRDATNLSLEEFWEPILRASDDPQTWALENIIVNDLVNSALFKQIRDSGIVGRDLNNVTDIFAQDGIMKTIADRLAFGLTNVKRSRYLISDEYRNLGRAQQAQQLAVRTEQLHDETIDGVRLMMQFLRNSDSDELAQGILEVFSMSDKIKNFTDFDNWMRQKLRGGDFANKTKQGVMMKELGAVMVNSILSSPKTPLRAIIGTTSNAFLNEVATLFGATIRSPFTGDVIAMRSSAASVHALFDTIPDAWKIFRANIDSNFSGGMSNVKTRYSEYTQADINFELLGKWAEKHGTNGDKAAFYITNTARRMNDNKLLTWSSRVLGATDDTFRWVMSKARSRKKAVEQILSQHGSDIKIDARDLKKAENLEFSRLHNSDGALDITKDKFLEKSFKEVTLTTELQGFAKGLNELMNRYPLTKPFFLFARTGLNGLSMSVKNLPIVGALVDESRAILGATPQMVKEGHLLKYGIETTSDLITAKSLVTGRQAIGSAVVYGVAQKYMSGGLTGNGPADESMKRMWIESGWQPRSIKTPVGWVSYDSFEPFNLVMANIADIGDNMQLMGEQYSEERLQLVVSALGKGVTSKTYLQGIGQLFDLLSGDAGYTSSRVVANLVNNQVPLSGMRNELGKVLNPYMRELGSSFWDHVANRNPIMKGTLPVKYDMLNGQPIQNWNFMTRAFNAVSPVQLNPTQSPGRQLLFSSGYDLRIAAFSAPDGTSLVRSPKVRSLYQSAIGQQNLEAVLNELAERPDIIASIRKMNRDLRSGNFNIDPMQGYKHNRIIKYYIKRAQRKAWASLRNNPLVLELKAKERQNVIANKLSMQETLLNIPK